MSQPSIAFNPNAFSYVRQLRVFPLTPAIVKNNKLLDFHPDLFALDEKFNLILLDVEPASQKDIEVLNMDCLKHVPTVEYLKRHALWFNNEIFLATGTGACNSSVAHVSKRLISLLDQAQEDSKRYNPDYTSGYQCTFGYKQDNQPDLEFKLYKVEEKLQKPRYFVHRIGDHVFFEFEISYWDQGTDLFEGVFDTNKVGVISSKEFVTSLQYRRRVEPIFGSRKNEKKGMELTTSFNFGQTHNCTTSIIVHEGNDVDPSGEEYSSSIHHSGNTVRLKFFKPADMTQFRPCYVGDFTDKNSIETTHQLLIRGVEAFNKCFADSGNKKSSETAISPIMQIIVETLDEVGIKSYAINSGNLNTYSPATEQIELIRVGRSIDIVGRPALRQSSIGEVDNSKEPLFILRVRQFIEPVSLTEFKSSIMVTDIKNESSNHRPSNLNTEEFKKFFSNVLFTNHLGSVKLNPKHQETITLPLF